MTSLPSSKTVTYEEWLRLPEVSDCTEEVVNGEIRITSPAKWKHAMTVERIRRALDAQLDPGRVLILISSFGLVIRREPLTSRVPDLAVFEISTMVERDGYVHSPPQLAVEVLSPANTRREREEKLGDYAAIGIPEVWLVSPEARTVEVLYLEDGYLRGNARILAQGLLKPKHFPNVQVDIAGIWPD
jgi:Uma2 family endonuclease